MTYSRRKFLEHALMATAAITAPRWASAQMATLESVGYLSRRLDITHAQFRAWYINHHAVDFLSFAKPHMVRYTQDYVERVHMGDGSFDVISHFGWRSAEDRATVLKFMGSPEGKAVMALHPRLGTKPGPYEDHSGSRTYSITERLVAGPARTYDPPATSKQVALLRRKDTTPEGFLRAANNYAGNIFNRAKGAAERVTINFAVPEPERPAPFHDAQVMVWPKNGTNLAGVMQGPMDGIEIAAVISLVSYDTNLG
ncbi:MAG: hypothetical protein K2P94_12455 [Rhodospirillaceae bacterium]|nr:hypothetical protein [Rhodospirillaceae bacterium]